MADEKNARHMALPASNITDTALVFEGGGMRASLTSGVANVLLDNHLYFDFVCGLSAGASNTVNYISRDRERVRRSFIDFAALPDHGGLRSILRGHGYFDAEYDYTGCVEDGFLPFDWETFVANPAQMCIQSFDGATGETRYFTKEDFPDLVTMANRVRMSSTLPGFMPPLELDGHLMFDGGLGERAGIPLHMAEKAGYKRFVFVATRPRGYRKLAPHGFYLQFLKGLRRRYPYVANALLTRHERYNEELARIEQLERDGRCLVIYPDIMPVESTTLDVAELRNAYLLGYDQATQDLPRLRQFLFGAVDGGPQPSARELVACLDDDKNALAQPLDQPTLAHWPDYTELS